MAETRAKNLILGALVADTAAMGTHWIYDQARLRQIAPDTPEFLPPDPAHYDGVPAYFAHGSRSNGQTSHYGEQVIVMMDALAAGDGAFDATAYAQQFRQHFGYGGPWVGYIDNTTRETLNNFVRTEDAARAEAETLNGDPRLTKPLVVKALELSAQHSGDALQTAFETAVRAAQDDDETVTFGLRVLEKILTVPRKMGAADEQMPAAAKLPPLVAHLHAKGISDGDDFFTAIDQAVRTTNDHPRAIAFGRVCARMMSAALDNDDIGAIVEAGRKVAAPPCLSLIDAARDMLDQDNAAVTKHFGMACDLNQGVPSLIHNALTTSSYSDAIRRNILAGGDSCGRGVILGAILGAVYGRDGDAGIPFQWIQRLSLDRRHRDPLV